VAGCGECGDEPSGSCATELVSSLVSVWDSHLVRLWLTLILRKIKRLIQTSHKLVPSQILSLFVLTQELHLYCKVVIMKAVNNLLFRRKFKMVL
jgi:hypothetical protein